MKKSFRYWGTFEVDKKTGFPVPVDPEMYWKVTHSSGSGDYAFYTISLCQDKVVEKKPLFRKARKVVRAVVIDSFPVKYYELGNERTADLAAYTLWQLSGEGKRRQQEKKDAADEEALRRRNLLTTAS